MGKILQKKTKQSGQTLIETLVAAFVLTMGITSAVGLAIFALNTSTNITNQIVALGLAREGLEAVKNMRDTNWLRQPSIDNTCFNYVTNNLTGKCYQNWQDQYYCIDPTDNMGNCNGSGITSQNFALLLDPPGTNNVHYHNTGPSGYWDLIRQPASGGRYSLDFILSTSNQPFYRPNTSSATAGNSDYFRKIVIQEESGSPFNQSTLGPRLRVSSQVWWKGKKCPSGVADWPGVGTCSVELVTYLTNWKDY